MSLTEKLKTKLLSCLPKIYKLDWKGKKNEPVRFRTNAVSSDVVILNTIWTEMLEKITRCQHVKNDQYIRINTDYSDETTMISIFPTGTIMFQGATCLTWLDEYIENICSEIEAEIDDHKLQSSDESLLSETSIIAESSNSQSQELSLKFPTPKVISLKPPVSSTPKIADFHLASHDIDRVITLKSPEIVCTSPTEAYLSNIQNTLNTVNENDSGNSEGVIGEMKTLSKEVANNIKESLTQKNWESVRIMGYHHDTYNQSGILSSLDLSVPPHNPNSQKSKQITRLDDTWPESPAYYPYISDKNHKSKLHTKSPNYSTSLEEATLNKSEETKKLNNFVNASLNKSSPVIRKKTEVTRKILAKGEKSNEIKSPDMVTAAEINYEEKSISSPSHHSPSATKLPAKPNISISTQFQKVIESSKEDLNICATNEVLTSPYKFDVINDEILTLNHEKKELENELEVIKGKLKMNDEICEKVIEMKQVTVKNHRLMHRNPTNIIKEYVILEGKYFILKKK